MFFNLKKLFFIVTFNFSLFLLLIIGLQNSGNRKKVNLIINETVLLPTGFIVGTSFISGSFIGFLLKIKLNNNQE